MDRIGVGQLGEHLRAVIGRGRNVGGAGLVREASVGIDADRPAVDIGSVQSAVVGVVPPVGGVVLRPAHIAVARTEGDTAVDRVFRNRRLRGDDDRSGGAGLPEDDSIGRAGRERDFALERNRSVAPARERAGLRQRAGAAFQRILGGIDRSVRFCGIIAGHNLIPPRHRVANDIGVDGDFVLVGIDRRPQADGGQALAGRRGKDNGLEVAVELRETAFIRDGCIVVRPGDGITMDGVVRRCTFRGRQIYRAVISCETGVTIGDVAEPPFSDARAPAVLDDPRAV